MMRRMNRRKKEETETRNVIQRERKRERGQRASEREDAQSTGNLTGKLITVSYISVIKVRVAPVCQNRCLPNTVGSH